FDAEAGELCDLVRALLAHEGDRGGDLAWRARLDALATQLSPVRTALRWEYEGKLDLAGAIVERQAASAPPDAVSWDVLARLRGLGHDLDGALDAALAALDARVDGAVREVALVVRRLAADVGRHRGAIERAVAAVDRQRVPLGDVGRLHFAHIE